MKTKLKKLIRYIDQLQLEILADDEITENEFNQLFVFYNHIKDEAMDELANS